MSYWTTERVARLRKLWAEGLTGEAIGRRMGVSRSAALAAARRFNLPARPRGKAAPLAPPPKPVPMHVRIVALAMEGLPPRIIAERVGTNNRVVSVALSKARAAGVAIPYVAPPARKPKPRLARPVKAKAETRDHGGGLGRNIKERRGKAFFHNIKQDPKHKTPPKPVCIAAPAEEPASRDLAVTDLRDGQCRWPHGEGPFTFCGNGTEDGAVYCPHHARRAYQPPAGRVYIGNAA